MKVICIYLTLSVFVFVSCNQEQAETQGNKSAIKNTLLFEENFNGEELNSKVWNYDLGDGCPNLCGWGNNERQLYTKENVAVNDGQLVITSTKQDSLYHSGKIHTKDKFEFQYGTVEVKAKLPTGYGLWPAIWMLGHDIDTKGWPACGEIDIMEYVGKEPNTLYTSLHTPSSFGNTINSKKTLVKNLEEGYHVYKTKWTSEAITFYINDKEMYKYAPKEKNDETWPFDKSFYIIMNTAIGGNFGGPKVDDSIFPKKFEVDYVRVYSL